MDTIITEEKAAEKKDNTVLYIVYAAAAYFGLQYLLQPKRVAAAMVVQPPVKEAVIVDDTTMVPPARQTASAAAQVPATNVNESFPLRKGMRGQRIKAIQQKLGITADGIFGNGTEAALIRQYRISTVSEVQYRNIMQPGQKPFVSPVSHTVTTTVLKKGSKGKDVYRLQQWLGFKDKRIAKRGEPIADSDFGTHTETALLKKTGRAWISTASLNKYLQKKPTTQY